MRNWRYIVYIVVISLAISFPFYAGVHPIHVATTILSLLALALSWDILLRGGQLSLGVSAFFGIGSYTTVLTHLNWEVSPLLSIVLGGLAAGVVALVIGLAVLRLRGLYFAIVTLALTFIFIVIVRNLTDLTGGAIGKLIPSVIFGGDPAMIYWLTLAIAVATIITSEIFQKTRIHFALTSIRNNEIAAKSSGIDIFKYLLFAFAVTAVIQGVVGGVHAQRFAFVSPEESFSLDFTILPLAMCLLGGSFSTLGSVIGAGGLGVLAEYLRLMMPRGHLAIYGLVMVMAILLMPKGIVGTIREQLVRRKTASS